jgi:hypothetical protein
MIKGKGVLTREELDMLRKFEQRAKEAADELRKSGKADLGDNLLFGAGFNMGLIWRAYEVAPRPDAPPPRPFGGLDEGVPV